MLESNRMRARTRASWNDQGASAWSLGRRRRWACKCVCVCVCVCMYVKKCVCILHVQVCFLIVNYRTNIATGKKIRRQRQIFDFVLVNLPSVFQNSPREDGWFGVQGVGSCEHRFERERVCVCVCEREMEREMERERESWMKSEEKLEPSRLFNMHFPGVNLCSKKDYDGVAPDELDEIVREQIRYMHGCTEVCFAHVLLMCTLSPHPHATHTFDPVFS